MNSLHHQDRNHLAALEAERHRAAARRRRPPECEPGELVAAVRGGDPQAWAQVRERYGARVRGVARRHRLSAHDVEDVAQNTWLRLFQHIGSIRDPNALGAWLETTARRESLRLLDAARCEFSTEHQALPDPPAPAVPLRVFLDERREALRTALGRLPERHAAMMRMLVAEPAASYEEIARVLSMPVGSIGPIRARSLERLRRDPELADALAA
jgi:RNA polymerase sigma factor (sigma-70 family)